MKNLKITALALVAGIAVSCGGGGTGALVEPYHISFDLASIDRSAPFPTMSEMVEDIEYVKLEYVPEHPVGDVDNLTVGNDYLLVYDNDWGLFHYTRDGRFVRMIGSRGRGPGEYLGIGHIYVDEKEGIVNLLCRTATFSVLKYELATGKFLGDVAITESDGGPLRPGTRLGNPVPFADGLFLSTSGSIFGHTDDKSHIDAFITLDIPAARITHRGASGVYTPRQPSIMLPQPLWRDTEGRVTVYENGADTMWVVNSDYSRTPRIVADFGNQKLNLPFSDKETGVGVSSAKETGRYILFSLMDGTPPFEWKFSEMSFDKITGERSLAPKLDDWFFEGPANDIDGGYSYLKAGNEGIWWESYYAVNMIENLTPEHFERVRGAVKYPDRLEKLQALVATLSEDDNPVVAIARLKSRNAGGGLAGMSPQTQ